MSTKTTWIKVEIKHGTKDKLGYPKAWLVTNGHREAWVPAAAVVDSDEDLKIGMHTRIEIATSLAEDKGLV